MIVLFGSNFVFFIVIPFGTAHFVCWGSGGGASKKTCCIRNNVLFKISSQKWRHAFVWLISQGEVVWVDGVLSNADEK